MTLVDAVTSGDYRKALVALRDFLVHEIDRGRCPVCGVSAHSAADTAALTLRLTKVLEELQRLGAEVSEGVDELEHLRARRDRTTNADLPPSSDKCGTKAGERRQGGRRPRKTGEA